MRSKMIVENLYKSTGDEQVLSAVSFTVEEGEIFGLLGHKGAGKTALLHLLGGVTSPDAGMIAVDGVQLNPDWREYKKKVGYLPDSIGFYETMTARENLRLFGDLYGLPVIEREERIKTLLSEVGLDSVADEPVRDWNPSLIHRLGLAKTLLHHPEVIILDEPERDLNLAAKKIFRRVITRLSREGKTILLSSGELEPIFRLCTSVGVLTHGRLYMQGEVGSFQRRLREEIYKVEIRLDRLPEDGVPAPRMAALLPVSADTAETSAIADIQALLIQHGLEVMDVWEGRIVVMGLLDEIKLCGRLTEEGFAISVQTLEPTEEELMRYLCTRMKWDDEWGGGFRCGR